MVLLDDETVTGVDPKLASLSLRLRTAHCHQQDAEFRQTQAAPQHV